MSGSLRCGVAVAVLATVACGPDAVGPAAPERRGEEANPAAVAPSPARGMNLVVVTIDSLRPRNLAPYGYERSTMPAVEAWAAESVVVPKAYATSAWTFPGLASLLTGLYPGRHGLDARGRELREVPTLHDELVRAGYRVPTVHHYPGTPGFRTLEIEPRWADPATGRSGNVIGWLRSPEARERPFFAWAHWRGTHLPYDPPPPHDTAFGAGSDHPAARLVREFVIIPAEVQAFVPEDVRPVVDQYDATLRATDERWAELLEALARSDLLERTVVVLSADHGEELLEHELVGHASTTQYAQLYDEVLEIPLILSVPGAALSAPGCNVSQVDVMPTLLALLGLPVPEGLDGRDLSAAFAGGPCPTAPMFAESIQGGFQAREESARTFLWAVRDGRHKLIVTRAPHSERIELYDLDADPGEQVDLVTERPEVVERLAALLDGLVDRSGGPGYWRGRLADKEPDPKAASEVLAAPRILAPAVGSALEFEASGAAIAGHWTGSPAATYVVEYDVGEGANRTQGTFEVEGNRYEFGPVPREVWRNLSQFNPWRLRLWPRRAPDKKSPWAEFTVVDPGSR